MTFSGALTAFGLPGGVVLLTALLARLFDAQFSATPLIDEQARGYYLASFVILGLVLAGEVVRYGLGSPALPMAFAGWTLSVCAATLFLAGYRNPLPLLVATGLAIGEYWSRDSRQDSNSTGKIIAVLTTVGLLALLLTGLLGFHLRWLFALPMAAFAAALAAARFEPPQDAALGAARGSIAVMALAAAQLVAAVSFLDVSPATGAALIVVSLAGVYLVDWFARARSAR